VRDDLARRLAPVSAKYLRGLLRESGYPLAPLVEGVRQGTLDELERTLIALQREYEQAQAEANREAASLCRELVLEARTHAIFARRRGTAGKDEMIEWIRVWLENPPLFEAWVRLRRSELSKPDLDESAY